MYISLYRSYLWYISRGTPLINAFDWLDWNCSHTKKTKSTKHAKDQRTYQQV